MRTSRFGAGRVRSRLPSSDDWGTPPRADQRSVFTRTVWNSSSPWSALSVESGRAEDFARAMSDIMLWALRAQGVLLERISSTQTRLGGAGCLSGTQLR